MTENGNVSTLSSNNNNSSINSKNVTKFPPIIETVPVISPNNSLPPGGGARSADGSNENNTIITTNNIGEKLSTLKNWSVKQYKCKKQSVEEKIWKECRTIDEDCEKEIAALKELQHKYGCILEITQSSLQQLTKFLSFQRVLADQMQELSLVEMPQLQHDLAMTGQIQRTIGNMTSQYLIDALQHFVDGLNTLVSRTFEDTLLTVNKLEQCRLEYDATRNAAEKEAAAFQAKLKANAGSTIDAKAEARQEQLHQELATQRSLYAQFKEDVLTKKRLLEENRVRVVQRELSLLNGAVRAFLQGNHAAVESLLQARPRPPTPPSSPPF